MPVIKMAVEVDLLEHLSDLLASGDTRSMEILINEETFICFVEEKAIDIIPVASYYLTSENIKENPNVVRSSRKVLEKCAEKGNPKECLMEFLAQIESLDEVKFQFLLKPVETTLLRIPDRKAPLMLCVYYAIYSFINSLELPKDYHLDREHKVLLDCDENFSKIKHIYSLILDFYKPFVDEICETKVIDKRVKNLKLALTQALLQLLGNPLVSLDLEDHEKGSSVMRVLALKIVKFIVKVQPDPLQLLSLVENRELLSVEEEKSIIKEFSCNELKFSHLSLSVLVYLICHEKMYLDFPQVYDKFYVFKSCLDLALVLLQYKETLILRKGLLLTKAVLDNVGPGSVSFSHLASDTHKKLIDALSNIAIYHDIEENRKLAVQMIRQHFHSFQPKGQFYILLYCRSTSHHPNIVGFLTTMLTSLVRETFNNEALKEYFTGKRLLDLMNVYCSLKNGVETDLIENKDQVLSSLNLIIFLTRRDRQNSTGIWDHAAQLAEKLLVPLREGINLSRAHYQQELKTLSEPKSAEDGPKFAVTVGGQELGQMTVEEKKGVISSGLTVFDLLEHLLSRAEECVAEKPQS